MNDEGRLAAAVEFSDLDGLARRVSGLPHEPDRPPSAIGFPLAQILDEAETILHKKHEDYGPANVSQSPFSPMHGLLVRMWDKQARAINLISTGADANYESLEDTFIDLLNYSAIALLCLRGQWPGVQKGGMRRG